MERTMAFGASVRAPTVSSLTCAEASKPVMVYCASSRPRLKRYTVSITPPVQPVSNALSGALSNAPPMPRLLVGAMNRNPAMMTTPTTCHHTLMSPKIFTRLTLKVFNRPCTTSTAR